MTEISIRRQPQQSRSQQRMDLILDTAADLFGRVGYENATTNAMAEQAGISIGSLYRYFPDKEAILRALAARYHQRSRALYDQIFNADLVYVPLSVLLDRLIDPFLEMYTLCPAYGHILLGADVSTEIAAASAALEQEGVERIAGVLQLVAPHLDKSRAGIIAAVCKATVKALIALVTNSTSPEFQAQVTVEVKRMLLAYLTPILNGD
jgi:AcrR family transcriptional regulator